MAGMYLASHSLQLYASTNEIFEKLEWLPLDLCSRNNICGGVLVYKAWMMHVPTLQAFFAYTKSALRNCTWCFF
jgi:hypothetical protein